MDFSLFFSNRKLYGNDFRDTFNDKLFGYAMRKENVFDILHIQLNFSMNDDKMDCWNIFKDACVQHSRLIRNISWKLHKSLACHFLYQHEVKFSQLTPQKTHGMQFDIQKVSYLQPCSNKFSGKYVLIKKNYQHKYFVEKISQNE